MSSFNIASRYAKALMVLALEKDELNDVADDMELVLDSITASKDLRTILRSPVIKLEKKQIILNQIYKNRISNLSSKFIDFVVIKNREDILLEILKRFKELFYQNTGRVEADVISAVDLSETQKNELKKSIERYTNKEVSPVYSIDESLIGGFIVKINDTVHDSSINYQLKKLKMKLLEQQNFVVNSRI